MYDAKYIIPGLIVFVALMTFPIWKNMGNAGPVPKPEKPVGVTKCIDSAKYMRTSHMKVLDNWRDECLRCHSDKKKFCDECHTYTSVKPYCWDCHFVPKEMF